MALWQLKSFDGTAGTRRIGFVDEAGQKDELLIEVDDGGRFEAEPHPTVGIHWFARRCDRVKGIAQ